MLVLVITCEVSFTGIDVPFALVVNVILDSIVGHGITSLVGCFVVGHPSCLVKRYVTKRLRQCEPVGWLVVGQVYHSMGGGRYRMALIVFKNAT